MSKSAVRYGKRTAARLQAIRRKAAEWKRRARRALTLALVTAGVAAAPSLAEAQMGQMGMAPTGGVLNRAVAGFQGLNQNGPGWMYYGINAADRGLGYNGSYMTLGGFIPYAEDDLGGFWAADLRGHLSEYGGFFSNVGAVRKQFIGGTLLGVGVYWDYDGDMNQYPIAGIQGAQFGQFGHAYNQVGISAEWLTDYGNLRSNGYLPVGTTGYVAGAPNSPYFQNFLMCQYGLDAALAGTDLEVGAYIPGLADWAGMISVGGYALGNSRYDWNVGPLAGQDIVPWFGGVYTRLDMTFIENWDFSLQANNDSYFDWTGFARLTYRMGGSRRRNVPDQMEQPMMRNEHIVRAHQTPIVALNPNNGNQPWRVIHVNNAATPVGNGTAEAPFTTITNANAAATNPWDIVLVARGNSGVNMGGNFDPTNGPYGQVLNAYAGTFSPLAANQYFIGEGSPFAVPTANCGPIAIGGAPGLRPVLSNPTGPSINLTNGLVTNNFGIVNSAVGISGSGNMNGAGTNRPSVATNIDIYRTDPTATARGIEITNATGTAVFRKVNVGTAVALPNGTTQEWTMTDGSVVVDGGSPTIDFADGSILNTQDNILQVNGTLGGEVVLTANPGKPFQETGDGILVENAAGNVTVQNKTPGMISATIASKQDGIKVVNSSGVQTFNDVEITKAGGAGYAGVNLQNNVGTTNFNNLDVTLTDPNTSPGFLAVNDNVINVTGNSKVTVDNAVAVSMTKVADVDATFTTITSTNSTTNGLLLDNVAGAFTVSSALTVTDAAQDGVVIRNSPALTFNSPTTTVSSAGGDGVVLQNNALTAAKTQLGQLNVKTAAGTGLVVTSAGASSLGGTIDATGGASIAANNADLDITLASVKSTDSTGPGLNLTQSSGTVAIAQTQVITPTGSGINAVDNTPGFAADFGVTKVTGITNGAVGVNIANTVDPVPATAYSFDSLVIDTQNGTGLRTRNGGTVNFNSPATITAAGGPAIDLENTTGTTGGVAGSGFTFQDLASTNSVTSGVRLNNLNSDLRVIGTTTISGAAAPSLSITDTVGPPQTDSISFNQVNITSRNNIGMLVDGIYGQVQVANLNIDNANNVAGDAVLIRNTTNPGDPIGTGSGRVYLNGGTIANSGGNGIQVQNALASISGVTVADSLAQSIIGTAGAGQQTTVLVSNSSLTGAIGIDGFRLEATGGGIVNGTLFSTLVEVPASSLNAIVFDAASFISLNASGNFGSTAAAPGVGGFVLDNQGGVLQIEQGSVAAMSSANNGVVVTVPNNPVTFGGSTPPVPPPTP